MLLTKTLLLRNAALIGQSEHEQIISLLKKYDPEGSEFEFVRQYERPFAMVECKRVGVEEGMKKGPQTIEKAKQGAYVAKSVSALQKIRAHDGVLHGVLPMKEGKLEVMPYKEMIEKIIKSSSKEWIENVVITIGFVSNHGNWFTAQNKNKELEVLAQSYDWLLFLTDEGLAEFISDVLLSSGKNTKHVAKAFRDSYPKGKSGNRFTKTTIDIEADADLRRYFRENSKKIEKWFNVIAPTAVQLGDLKKMLDQLNKKNWKEILKK